MTAFTAGCGLSSVDEGSRFFIPNCALESSEPALFILSLGWCNLLRYLESKDPVRLSTGSLAALSIEAEDDFLELDVLELGRATPDLLDEPRLGIRLSLVFSLDNFPSSLPPSLGAVLVGALNLDLIPVEDEETVELTLLTLLTSEAESELSRGAVE